MIETVPHGGGARCDACRAPTHCSSPARRRRGTSTSAGSPLSTRPTRRDSASTRSSGPSRRDCRSFPSSRGSSKTCRWGSIVPCGSTIPTFDLRRHIHRMTVPAPGGPRQTADAIAPIMSRQLDRRYPLWELWYLDGLVNGRVAILMKFHHCLLDGGAGSVLASLLLGFRACAGADERARRCRRPQPPPSDLRLFVEALLPAATAPLRAMRYGLRLTRRGVGIARHLISGHESPDMGNDAPRTQDVVQRVHRAAAVDGLQQRLDRRREGASPPLRREAQRRRARAVCGRAAVLPDRSRRAAVPPAVGRDPGLDASRRRHLARQPAVVSRGAASHQPRRSRRTTPCDRARNAGRQGRARGDAREPTRISRRHGAALHDRRASPARLPVTRPRLHPGNDEHDRVERTRTPDGPVHRRSARHRHLFGKRAARPDGPQHHALHLRRPGRLRRPRRPRSHPRPMGHRTTRSRARSKR